MTHSLYGWMVLKADGTPYYHINGAPPAFFEEQPVVRQLSSKKPGSRVVPATIVYES